MTLSNHYNLPADGWELYLLTDKYPNYYIGISSRPEGRLREHKKRWTLKGYPWFKKRYKIGFVWRALDIERALHALPIEEAVEIMDNEDRFWKFYYTVPHRDISEHKLWTQVVYGKYTGTDQLHLA